MIISGAAIPVSPISCRSAGRTIAYGTTVWHETQIVP